MFSPSSWLRPSQAGRETFPLARPEVFISWARPTTSESRSMPRLPSSSSSSGRILAHADGSWKIAVPMLTMAAPASRSSRPSGPVITPPIPIIGPSGSASRTCQMQRTATGLIAGPDRPPVSPASTGRIVSVSIAMPSNVLIIDRPSAPADTHERAIATMSVTSGDSLANTGMSYRVRALTAAITAPASVASQANTWPRCSTFGHEMLTSSAVTPAASDNRAASSAYSSTVLPAIDTTALAPRESSHGRSRCKNASIPGPCKPIELSMPLLVSAIRGVGRPALGASITDLVTIAPILETSMNWASSRPELAQPEAVRMGLGSSTFPSLVRRSGAMSRPPYRTRMPRLHGLAGLGGLAGRPAAGLGRAAVAGRLPWARAAPGPGFPAGRAERVERDGADVIPAHLLAAEHRPVDAGSDHTGDPVGADHRQHAGHADTDPACHRFLDRHLHGNVIPAGQRRHLAKHRHRPARVDHVGPCLVDHLAEHVGHDPADAERAVHRGDRRRPASAPSGQRAENPVTARGAEEEVHRAAPFPHPVSEREQRRAAVSAPHEQAAHRIPGNRERPAERAGQVEHVPGAALGQPPGPRS